MGRLLKISIVAILAYTFCSKSVEAQNLEFVSSTLWTDVYSVEVSGNYAYCLYSNGLQILDITNPVSPVIVGSAFFPTNDGALKISGDYAYIVSGSDGHFQIFNISDPANPTSEGGYDFQG
jgi:hypothetical protein